MSFGGFVRTGGNRYERLDAGYWSLDEGYWMRDTGWGKSRAQETGLEIRGLRGTSRAQGAKGKEQTEG
jgi:hypothetical protein